jgi:hypothetical protein
LFRVIVSSCVLLDSYSRGIRNVQICIAIYTKVQDILREMRTLDFMKGKQAMKNRSNLWKLGVLFLTVVACCILTGLRCPDLCYNNNHCRSYLFCAKPPGNCDGLGRCVPRPEACPEIYDPVCGCDGLTYENECVAAAAGVNVVHMGACGVLGCLSNEDCFGPDPSGLPTDYCEKAMGDCDGRGVCVPIPQACYEIYAPVCGCDGLTYSNDCYAAAAGVNVLAEGLCEDIFCDPAACGPPPAMPNYMCEDGTWAGPTGRCLRSATGICSWEIRECP